MLTTITIPDPDRFYWAMFKTLIKQTTLNITNRIFLQLSICVKLFILRDTKKNKFVMQLYIC